MCLVAWLCAAVCRLCLLSLLLRCYTVCYMHPLIFARMSRPLMSLTRKVCFAVLQHHFAFGRNSADAHKSISPRVCLNRWEGGGQWIGRFLLPSAFGENVRLLPMLFIHSFHIQTQKRHIHFTLWCWYGLGGAEIVVHIKELAIYWLVK